MSAPELRIRPLSVADIDRVMEIAAQLDQAPHWPRSVWLAAVDPANSPRRLGLVAVAEPDGDAIAFALASVLPPEAELESIGVAEQAQRHGVGAQLFRTLLAQLHEKQIGILILEVRSSNQPAICFYRAQGFEEIGKRPRYYADPEEDALLMALRLESSSK